MHDLTVANIGFQQKAAFRPVETDNLLAFMQVAPVRVNRVISGQFMNPGPVEIEHHSSIGDAALGVQRPPKVIFGLAAVNTAHGLKRSGETFLACICNLRYAGHAGAQACVLINSCRAKSRFGDAVFTAACRKRPPKVIARLVPKATSAYAFKAQLIDIS
jgi:hypothetical protein